MTQVRSESGMQLNTAHEKLLKSKLKTTFSQYHDTETNSETKCGLNVFLSTVSEEILQPADCKKNCKATILSS
jgi:hypothetical protein